jgi:hypothetical protein
MSILDFLEAWWLSVRAMLEATGVVARFERSATDRLNPSCNINLRRGERETDLSVWDSGEAELSVVEFDGSVSQKHFDDVRNQQNLGEVLSRLASIATTVSSK